MIPQINTTQNEQEKLQFLGFLGIFKESIKLILAWPKIFFQITIFLILPQSCILLVDNWVFKTPHFNKNYNNIPTLEHNNQLTLRSPSYENILGSMIFNQNVTYTLTKSTVLWIISIISSFVTISSIAYTISYIYQNEKVSFKKVISVLPKVWKPFMITYLSWYCVIFIYTIVLVIWALIFVTLDKQYIFIGGLVLFVVGMVYVSIIWEFSITISVLENIRGFNALKKSKELIKGKLSTALGILLVLIILEAPIIAAIIHDQLLGGEVQLTIWFGIFKVVWSTLTCLLGYVSQVVFYFVCKSYHQQENIEKISSLTTKNDNLNLYLGEYVPLKEEVI